MRFLNEREELVLRTIIDQFISTNEPIGSRNVSSIGPLKMSPATIRNIMADLVDLGFINQPHASAGRVPTDDGYRYYIDKLISMKKVSPALINNMQKEFEFDPINIDDFFRTFSKKLSDLTNSVGFIVSPKNNSVVLKHIEFVRLNKESVVVIIVAKTGYVQNIILPVDSSVTDSDLVSMANIINESFIGKKLVEVKTALTNDLFLSKNKINDIITKTQQISESLFTTDIFKEEFIFEGTINLIGTPDVKDFSKLKEVLKTFEEQKKLCEILDKCIKEDSVQIFVGSEIGLEGIDDMGIVLKPYQRGGDIIGTMGVIGPKRMQYPQIASIVDCSSQIMSKMLNDYFGGNNE